MGNIELFEQMAQQYDTADRVEAAKIIAAAIRRHVTAVEAGQDEEPRSKSALDYGCGTGLVGLELADLFGSILLVDAAEQMVRQAERKIESMGLRTATALQCDLASGTAQEFRADYVIVVQVLLHIREIEPLLSRLFALLNDGGHLLVVDFDKNEAVVSDQVHNGFDQTELVRLCKSIGFADAKAETFHHEKEYFMGKDASLFLLDAVKKNTGKI